MDSVNKGITRIVYNHLNLPERVEMGSSANRVEYVYDASGTKLAQKVYENDTLARQTTYIGNIIYEQEGTGAPVLSLIQHEEGIPVARFQHYCTLVTPLLSRYNQSSLSTTK